MDLGELIYRELSGGLSPRTEAGDLPRMLAAVVRAAGGPTAAARAIGVHPSTMRRWRAGKSSPSARSAPLLMSAVRRARLTPAREKRIRRSNVTLHLQYRGEIRERDVNNGNLSLSPNVGDDLCNAFLRGAGTDELRRIFKNAVRDRWYSEWIDADDQDIDDPDSYGFDVQSITFT